MNATHPVTRPNLDGWLRARKLNYSTGAQLFGCSRMSLQRYCLPFDDPKRRYPSKQILRRIVTATGGEITGHDFVEPPATNGHVRANTAEVAA